ncbi:DUF3232 domain-containing protein [Candidatus Parcubacteria bacterium]|nr:DUF3232 domain-containing protein [Candidatus Parcubacteria bacterium]
MGFSHESYINELNSEFPEEMSAHVAEVIDHPTPNVSEEYLLELCGDDEELKELLDEMFEYFYRYTQDVCLQESEIAKGITRENVDEINRMDEMRTRLHNSMIDSVKIFARNLQKKGKSVEWLTSIDNRGRAGYARLALLTTFLDIINRSQIPNHGR